MVRTTPDCPAGRRRAVSPNECAVHCPLERSSLPSHTYFRFAVTQHVGAESRPAGLFRAAYYLRSSEDLDSVEYEHLQTLLSWFGVNLPTPHAPGISRRAIFWYTDIQGFSGPMWELAELLSRHGYTVEMITETEIGTIVYRDDFQVAAIPKGRRK